MYQLVMLPDLDGSSWCGNDYWG